jgi:hypothetical protein
MRWRPLIWSVLTALLSFAVTECEAANGPRIVLGEVVVVAQAPAGEPQPKWGEWQFPQIERLADGRIHIAWSVAEDSARFYGVEQAHAVSGDDGMTWTRVSGPAAARLRGGVLLANGDRLMLAQDPSVPADRVTLPQAISDADPVWRKGIASGDIRFYRFGDFSGEMRKAYPQLRMTAGSSTWVKEYPNVRLPGEVILKMGEVLVRPFFWGKLRIAADGSLWTSCYWPSLKNGVVSGYCPTFVKSTDNGHTWNFVSDLPYDPDKSGDPGWEGCLGFCEPDIAFAADGAMITLLRSGQGGISYVARSTDRGEHWGKPLIFDSFGVWPQLLVLRSGVTLAAYGRPGVRVRASSDRSGMSWGEPVDVPIHKVGNESGTCGYAGLVALGEKEGMLVFSDFGCPDRTGNPRKSICVVRIGIR